MNPTEQLLNQYGLTMTNQEYERKMRKTMADASKFFPVRKDTDDLMAIEQKKILHAFFIETNGVYIGDLTAFKTQFRIEAAEIRFPDSLWGITQLHVETSDPENPFRFDIRDYKDTIRILNSSLEKPDAGLQVYLKRFRLQNAFKAGEQLPGTRMRLIQLFNEITDKLAQTPVMKEFNTELMEHLMEKFAKVGNKNNDNFK